MSTSALRMASSIAVRPMAGEGFYCKKSHPRVNVRLRRVCSPEPRPIGSGGSTAPYQSRLRTTYVTLGKWGENKIPDCLGVALSIYSPHGHLWVTGRLIAWINEAVSAFVQVEARLMKVAFTMFLGLAVALALVVGVQGERKE